MSTNLQSYLSQQYQLPCHEIDGTQVDVDMHAIPFCCGRELLPHQEACVFPWTGKYPQLPSLGCLFTTRTSFWAKVQEIASDAPRSPTD